MESLNQSVLENLGTFVAFARQRLGNPHLAEDAVQESLAKALASDLRPDNAEDATAWFYRILRRTIIDLYRRRDASSRALGRFERELAESPGPDDHRLLCECFRRLLPAVPKAYRELLERIDLQREDPGVVAQELGVTRNNLTVRLHRGRRHLRRLLAENCRACSTHGCLDCTCEDPRTGTMATSRRRPTPQTIRDSRGTPRHT